MVVKIVLLVVMNLNLCYGVRLMNLVSFMIENWCILFVGGWKMVFLKVEKSVGILEMVCESNVCMKVDVSCWVEELLLGEVMLLRI